MKRLVFSFALFHFACVVSIAWAGDPPPTPEAIPSKEQPVTVTYSAQGSARFSEVYTRNGSGQCPIISVRAEEVLSNIQWKSTWKKVRPIDMQYVTANSSTFTGHNVRNDTSDCGPSFPCISDFSFDEGYYPQLRIKKSGKSYIVTLNAENGLFAQNASSSTCFFSSIFDNAITEGMNYTDVTSLRIKLSKAKESKKSRIKFNLKKSFDCADPAKTMTFLSNACTITTDISGTLLLNGKWTGKLMK